MTLKKHIIDTIKEWQVKIGYREGNMKLYYPGESLELMLEIPHENIEQDKLAEKELAEEKLAQALEVFCDEMEPQLGRIIISGSYERYCLDIPAKGCAYVAGKVPEPEFLKLFVDEITKDGNTMEQIRECFAAYAQEKGTSYVEEMAENHIGEDEQTHSGNAFYFQDITVEEYVYWVEENEFGLSYHRFTREEYGNLKKG